MSEGFRWNAFNIEHATKHGCSIAEIEMVVRREVRRARKAGHEKWIDKGRGIGERVIEVIFRLRQRRHDHLCHSRHAVDHPAETQNAKIISWRSHENRTQNR